MKNSFQIEMSLPVELKVRDFDLNFEDRKNLQKTLSSLNSLFRATDFELSVYKTVEGYSAFFSAKLGGEKIRVKQKSVSLNSLLESLFYEARKEGASIWKSRNAHRVAIYMNQ